MITQDGKPVAILTPPPRNQDPAPVPEVIEQFKQYSKTQGRTLDGTTFRELIDEGRRF